MLSVSPYIRASSGQTRLATQDGVQCFTVNRGTWPAVVGAMVKGLGGEMFGWNQLGTQVVISVLFVWHLL